MRHPQSARPAGPSSAAQAHQWQKEQDPNAAAKAAQLQQQVDQLLQAKASQQQQQRQRANGTSAALGSLGNTSLAAAEAAADSTTIDLRASVLEREQELQLLLDELRGGAAAAWGQRESAAGAAEAHIAGDVGGGTYLDEDGEGMREGWAGAWEDGHGLDAGGEEVEEEEAGLWGTADKVQEGKEGDYSGVWGCLQEEGEEREEGEEQSSGWEQEGEGQVRPRASQQEKASPAASGRGGATQPSSRDGGKPGSRFRGAMPSGEDWTLVLESLEGVSFGVQLRSSNMWCKGDEGHVVGAAALPVATNVREGVWEAAEGVRVKSNAPGGAAVAGRDVAAGRKIVPCSDALHWEEGSSVGEKDDVAAEAMQQQEEREDEKKQQQGEEQAEEGRVGLQLHIASRRGTKKEAAITGASRPLEEQQQQQEEVMGREEETSELQEQRDRQKTEATHKQQDGEEEQEQREQKQEQLQQQAETEEQEEGQQREQQHQWWQKQQEEEGQGGQELGGQQGQEEREEQQQHACHEEQEHRTQQQQQQQQEGHKEQKQQGGHEGHEQKAQRLRELKEQEQLLLGKVKQQVQELELEEAWAAADVTKARGLMDDIYRLSVGETSWARLAAAAVSSSSSSNGDSSSQGKGCGMASACGVVMQASSAGEAIPSSSEDHAVAAHGGGGGGDTAAATSTAGAMVVPSGDYRGDDPCAATAGREIPFTEGYLCDRGALASGTDRGAHGAFLEEAGMDGGPGSEDPRDQVDTPAQGFCGGVGDAAAAASLNKADSSSSYPCPNEASSSYGLDQPCIAAETISHAGEGEGGSGIGKSGRQHSSSQLGRMELRQVEGEAEVFQEHVSLQQQKGLEGMIRSISQSQDFTEGAAVYSRGGGGCEVITATAAATAAALFPPRTSGAQRRYRTTSSSSSGSTCHGSGDEATVFSSTSRTASSSFSTSTVAQPPPAAATASASDGVQVGDGGSIVECNQLVITTTNSSSAVEGIGVSNFGSKGRLKERGAVPASGSSSSSRSKTSETSRSPARAGYRNQQLLPLRRQAPTKKQEQQQQKSGEKQQLQGDQLQQESQHRQLPVENQQLEIPQQQPLQRSQQEQQHVQQLGNVQQQQQRHQLQPEQQQQQQGEEQPATNEVQAADSAAASDPSMSEPAKESPSSSSSKGRRKVAFAIDVDASLKSLGTLAAAGSGCSSGSKKSGGINHRSTVSGRAACGNQQQPLQQQRQVMKQQPDRLKQHKQLLHSQNRQKNQQQQQSCELQLQPQQQQQAIASRPEATAAHSALATPADVISSRPASSSSSSAPSAAHSSSRRRAFFASDNENASLTSFRGSSAAATTAKGPAAAGELPVSTTVSSVRLYAASGSFCSNKARPVGSTDAAAAVTATDSGGAAAGVGNVTARPDGGILCIMASSPSKAYSSSHSSKNNGHNCNDMITSSSSEVCQSMSTAEGAIATGGGAAAGVATVKAKPDGGILGIRTSSLRKANSSSNNISNNGDSCGNMMSSSSSEACQSGSSAESASCNGVGGLTNKRNSLSRILKAPVGSGHGAALISSSGERFSSGVATSGIESACSSTTMMQFLSPPATPGNNGGCEMGSSTEGYIGEASLQAQSGKEQRLSSKQPSRIFRRAASSSVRERQGSSPHGTGLGCEAGCLRGPVEEAAGKQRQTDSR